MHLRDCSTLQRSRSSSTYISMALCFRFADSSECRQVVTRYVIQCFLLPFLRVRLRFESLSLFDVVAVKSDSKCELAVAVGFRLRFDFVSCSFMNCCQSSVFLCVICLPVSRLAIPSWSASEVLKIFKIARFSKSCNLSSFYLSSSRNPLRATLLYARFQTETVTKRSNSYRCFIGLIRLFQCCVYVGCRLFCPALDFSVWRAHPIQHFFRLKNH